MEPLEPGKGREVDNKIKGGVDTKRIYSWSRKRSFGVASAGAVAGFPVIDYKVTILDEPHHDVDSSVLAFGDYFKNVFFQRSMYKATLKLLEPMMKVEVVTPEEFMGDVIGDLNSRKRTSGFNRS